MLQAIRDRTRGWIAYVIVAILVVPFALFGLYNYIGGGGPQVVASVDGEEISRQQFDQAWQQRQSELRQLLGSNFDLSQLNASALRRDVLDELVDRQLLVNFARTHGLQVSDADVVNAIRSQPLFQIDGAFSAERYRSVLAQNRLSAERYESQLRRDLVLDLVARSLGMTTFANERELDQIMRLQWQERLIGWTEVPQSAFLSDVSPSRDQVEDYFSETSNRYRVPERVRLEYVELDPMELTEQVQISDQEIAARYEQLVSAEEARSARRIRHILLDSEDTALAARDTIQSGASFADVAAEASLDSGSAGNGGMLGVLQRGDVGEAFETAAWALREGELSEPVETPAGWHLIEVTEIRQGRLPPLSEMADEIADELARAEADRLSFEQGNTLDTLAFDNPDSLQPAADALGREIRSTDWLSRGQDDSGFGAEPAVQNAAFSEAVLTRGENSQLLELSGGRYAVVRVSEYQEARQQSLDEVRDQVEAALRIELADELAEEAAQQIASRLVDGQPIGDAVRGDIEDLVAVLEPEWIQRGSGELPATIADLAFRLPRVEDANVVETLAISTGWAVVKVVGVRDGDLTEIDEQMRNQIAESLRQVDGEIAFEAVLAELRAQARIRISEGTFD